MTKFETEITKAWEHGCPECAESSFELLSMEECRYSIAPIGDELDYAYDERIQGPQRAHREILCAECSTSLWTKDDGWIPELKGVVK